jgi:outer membrane protein OmpA-like peptidoglycan-associated protein/tetratricopeptide (TPR) repeat protein
MFWFVGFVSNLHAQKLSTKSKKAATLYKNATAFYAADKFELAKKPLYQAIKKDPSFIDAYILLSEVYYEQKDYQQQINFLEKAISIDSTFFVLSYYNLGIGYFYINEYDTAIKYFDKYFDKTRNPSSKKKTAEWIARARFAKSAVAQPKTIKAVNLGENVNSEYNEYWPSITADDQTLVFTVMIPRDTFEQVKPLTPSLANYYHEDFFRTKKNEFGKWEKRVQLSAPLNSLSNEGAQALSVDGNWMIFTACGRSDSRGSCDLYFSYRTDRGWSNPQNIGAPVNTPYFESQPSFSSDGRTLYFISNRGGGKGGNDIWRAHIIGFKSDGVPFFGKPENLGDKINTYRNESSPFIHPDNKTLYFSSDGWPGLGEMDLFLSRINEDGKFFEPVNLGYPINTAEDEVGLVVTANGEKAYFSSQRYNSSYGGRDIYCFEMPVDIRPLPVSYVKGRVFDMHTRKQLQAAFELKDLKTKKMVVEALSTDFSGEFLVCLPVGSTYALNVSKEGYLFYSDHFDMKEETSVTQPKILTIYLKPIKVGEQVVLKNIFFETDSYVLKSESEVELHKIVHFLQINPSVKIELIGYTDNQGTQEYNLNLSKKRAEAVQQYLIQSGIDANRVTSSGKGMEDPVTTNETEEGRAQNRRTELKIIERN